ncbi:hypothetical protein ILUMI_16825, partial [Ignelater luminosus]
YSNKLKQKPTKYPMLETNRSLPASTSVSPRSSVSPTSSRGKPSRVRPNSVGARRIMSGEGDPFTFVMPTLALDTGVTTEQAEKPFSPRKSNFVTRNIIPLPQE